MGEGEAGARYQIGGCLGSCTGIIVFSIGFLEGKLYGQTHSEDFRFGGKVGYTFTRDRL
jgi:hypothetical protein